MPKREPSPETTKKRQIASVIASVVDARSKAERAEAALVKAQERNRLAREALGVAQSRYCEVLGAKECPL